MGLLSKILGSSAERAAKDFFNDIKNDLGGSSLNGSTPQQVYQQPQQAAQPAPAETGPSGFSWGPVMPDEENQFNFNGKYHDYFEQVYRAEFPGYTIEKELPSNRSAAVFTFLRNGQKALVVEVISQKSSPYKARRDCAKENIPYLRFYYDHHGWWNTRRYVTERTKRALGI